MLQHSYEHSRSLQSIETHLNYTDSYNLDVHILRSAEQ